MDLNDIGVYKQKTASFKFLTYGDTATVPNSSIDLLLALYIEISLCVFQGLMTDHDDTIEFGAEDEVGPPQRFK